MEDLTLSALFYDLVCHSAVLVSKEVEYNKIKKDLDFFLTYGFINKNDINLSRGFLKAPHHVFRTIFINMNLTDYEKETLLQKITDYLYNFYIEMFKNADKRITTKEDLITYIFENALFSAKRMRDIFDIVSIDFILKFMRKTRLLYDNKYAEIFYDVIHWFETNSLTSNEKLFYDEIENSLLSNWLEYSRIVIEKSNLFE